MRVVRLQRSPPSKSSCIVSWKWFPITLFSRAYDELPIIESQPQPIETAESARSGNVGGGSARIQTR